MQGEKLLVPFGDQRLVFLGSSSLCVLWGPWVIYLGSVLYDVLRHFA
jgi:hypothetical protein